MKSVIYWFSGTGNSLSVADDLAKALGADLIPIVRMVNGNVVSADRIGVVFPVYAFGLPIIVRRFLKRTLFDKSKYIYTVATMGGLAGAAHHEAREALSGQGVKLAAGWSIAMPGNYPVMSSPPPDAKQESLFAKAQQRIAEIADSVQSGRTGIYEDTALPLRLVLGKWLHSLGISRFPDADSQYVAGANCTHCGLCAKVCPVANIRIVDGKPIWLHHCEQCMACLQWCPVQAIEFGKATVGKRRYHHPRYKARDLFLREEAS